MHTQCMVPIGYGTQQRMTNVNAANVSYRLGKYYTYAQYEGTGYKLFLYASFFVSSLEIYLSTFLLIIDVCKK